MAPDPDAKGGNGPLVPGTQAERGRVLDAEVLGPEEGEAGSGRASAGSRGPTAGGHWGTAGGPGAGNGWSEGGPSGGRFYRVGGVFTNGAGFGRVWTATGADGAGCLAPCVTFALFLVCLSQFGLLAAIGFAIFHLLGSIAGSIRAMRRLVEGRQPNPWSWRLGNWFISFMLTAWLAGGFNR